MFPTASAHHSQSARPLTGRESHIICEPVSEQELYRDITLKRAKKNKTCGISVDLWGSLILVCSRLMTVCPKKKDFKASSLNLDVFQTMGINHEGKAGFTRRKWTEILLLCLLLLWLILIPRLTHWCKLHSNKNVTKGMKLKKENLHHAE